MPQETQPQQPFPPNEVPCSERNRRLDRLEDEHRQVTAEFRTLCTKVDNLITKLETCHEYDTRFHAEHHGRTTEHEHWIKSADNRLTKLEGFTASAKWIIGSLIACTGTLVARVVSDWVQFGMSR